MPRIPGLVLSFHKTAGAEMIMPEATDGTDVLSNLLHAELPVSQVEVPTPAPLTDPALEALAIHAANLVEYAPHLKGLPVVSGIEKLRNEIAGLAGLLAETVEAQTTLSGRARPYPPSAPRPYTRQASELHELLWQSLASLQALEPDVAELDDILERRTRQGFINEVGNWLRMSFTARTQLKKTQRLGAEISDVGALHQDTLSILDKLDAIAPRTVRIVQELRRISAKGVELADMLAERHVTGAELNQSHTNLQHSGSHLQSIGKELETAVLAGRAGEIDLQVVEAVYNLTEKAQSSIRSHRGQIDHWGQQVRAIDQDIARTSQALTDVDTSIKALPTVDTNAATLSLTDLRRQVEDLRKRRHPVEVMALPALAADTQKTLNDARKLAAELRDVSDDLQLIQVQSTSQPQLINDLQKAMNAIADKMLYPVSWGTSSRKLRELAGEIQQLGPAEQRRSPVEIRTAAAALRVKATEIEKLGAHIRQITGEHRTFKVRVDQLTQQHTANWAQRAFETQRQALQYDPVNYNAALYVTNVNDYMQSLLQHTAQALPKPDDQQSEETLAARNQTLAQLLGEYERFGKRLDGIEKRTQELSRLTSEAEATLDQTIAGLDLLFESRRSPIFLSDPFKKPFSDLTTLRDKGRQLRGSDRSKGDVEARVREAAKLASDATVATRNLYDPIAKRTDQMSKSLEKELKLNDSLGPFPRDPQLILFRTHLNASRDQPSLPRGAPIQSLAQRIVALAPELEHLERDLPALATINQDLAAIQKRLAEAKTGAEAALKALEALTQQAWPPATYDERLVTSQRHSVTQARNQLEQSQTLEQYRERAMKLLDAYQSLNSGASLQQEKINTEQRTLLRYERLIERWADALESERRRHSLSSSADNEIREWIRSINRELEEVRRPRGQSIQRAIDRIADVWSACREHTFRSERGMIQIRTTLDRDDRVSVQISPL